MKTSFLLLVVLSNVLITGSFWPLAAILIAMIHELAHLGCMVAYGVPIKKIEFVGFGVRIDNTICLSYKKELIIYFAGPMVNLMISCVALLCKHCGNGEIYFKIGVISLLYATLNLLAIPPLDGFHIIHCLLRLKYAINVARIIEQILVIFSLVLIGIGLCLVFVNGWINVSLVLIYVVMLAQTILYFYREN